VRAVCEIADGAIVGSAFIKIIERHIYTPERADMLHETHEDMLNELRDFARSLKEATRW